MTSQSTTNTVGQSLTDGTGVSKITGSKFLKDFVADFLLTLSAGLGLDAAAEAFNLGQIIAAPEAAGIAVAGAFIRVLYRQLLRWATS